MNVGIGTEAACFFLFWEYINWIFCTVRSSICKSSRYRMSFAAPILLSPPPPPPYAAGETPIRSGMVPLGLGLCVRDA
jgi:hypothetical protein